jgi:hypothetical protein
MARPEGFEDAENIINGQKGIFGDDCAGLCGDSAMTAFSSAPRVTTPQGVIYDVVCENGDSGLTKILVEWPEIIAMKVNISPHLAFQGQQGYPQTQWGFDSKEQAWYPDVRCSRCNWPFRLMVSPGEIESNLRAGVSKGFLSDQDVQRIAQHCAMVRQRIGR